MVKGVSRQVIFVAPPDKKLFEQAIFILTEEAQQQGVTDEMLLKEAKKVIHSPQKRGFSLPGPLWACGGAVLVAVAWLITALA